MTCYYALCGSSKEVPELNIEIEEADARIIPHAMHAVVNGTCRIIVLSSDTECICTSDVLLGHTSFTWTPGALGEKLVLVIRPGIFQNTRWFFCWS